MTPRASLAALIADRGMTERAAQAAPLLFPEAPPSVAFVRCLLALPGMGTPPAVTVPEFVMGLIRAGWQARPVAFGPPQPGDLWVKADGERVPESLGFVGALSLDQTCFSAVGPDGERARVTPREVEFFLRLPCPSCEQRPAAPPRKG